MSREEKNPPRVEPSRIPLIGNTSGLRNAWSDWTVGVRYGSGFSMTPTNPIDSISKACDDDPLASCFNAAESPQQRHRGHPTADENELHVSRGEHSHQLQRGEFLKIQWPQDTAPSSAKS